MIETIMVARKQRQPAGTAGPPKAKGLKAKGPKAKAKAHHDRNDHGGTNATQIQRQPAGNRQVASGMASTSYFAGPGPDHE